MGTLQHRKLQEIKGYTTPTLYTGKEWYIGFYAFDPAINKLHRKKIKLNSISKIGERRKYADGLIKRLSYKLEHGWNPWIEAENEKAYHLFEDTIKHYKKYIEKLFIDGLYREDTYISYISYLNNITGWNDKKKIPITYIYQFNTDFINDFLEHIYIERNNSAQTRNNYLGFIRTFCTFLMQNRYLNINPAEGIPQLSRRKIKKNRTVIEECDMKRLYEHLNNTNRHFLLACYILHYCFIRPKEMSMIKLEHIMLKNQTIYIGEDVSKNRNSAVVTLPEKVIKLMIDLDVFKNPGSYYLFSNQFMPGEKYRDEKQFRDYWAKYVRKPLKFPATYKFYSLKDTGITSMLRQFDKITVRDQARHSSILMTDIYTPHDIQQANHLIAKHNGIF